MNSTYIQLKLTLKIGGYDNRIYVYMVAKPRVLFIIDIYHIGVPECSQS